jgi:hypothetical protein
MTIDSAAHSIMESYNYPKTGLLKTHPHCVRFSRHWQLQEDLLDEANLRSLVRKLPQNDTFCFAFDKTFSFEGKRLTYPIAMYIGCATGSLWACPDGNVVRETIHPFKQGPQFWTIEGRKIHPHRAFSGILPPFCMSPVLRDGLKSPMSPKRKLSSATTSYNARTAPSSPCINSTSQTFTS